MTGLCPRQSVYDGILAFRHIALATPTLRRRRPSELPKTPLLDTRPCQAKSHGARLPTGAALSAILYEKGEMGP